MCLLQQKLEVVRLRLYIGFRIAMPEAPKNTNESDDPNKYESQDSNEWDVWSMRSEQLNTVEEWILLPLVWERVPIIVIKHIHRYDMIEAFYFNKNCANFSNTQYLGVNTEHTSISISSLISQY